MLLSFSVSNFGSFNDKVIFSMYPGKISKQHENHILGSGQYKSLKGTALYGANASGKSNFVKAITALKAIVFGEATTFIPVSQFKLDRKNSITEFGVEFKWDKNIYEYIIHTDGKSIPFEQLQIIHKYGAPQILFTRKNEKIGLGKLLEKGRYWYENRTSQSTTSFLFKILQDGIIENQNTIAGAKHIINAINFFNNLFILTPQSLANPASFGIFLNHDDFKSYLKKLLKVADLGITDIQWIPISQEETDNYLKLAISAHVPISNTSKGTLFSKSSSGDMIAITVDKMDIKGYALRTIHNDVEFNITEESSGTRRLIDLALSFFYLHNPDICMVIDELDCHLHPFLSKFLIQEHMESDNKGQLVVTLHDLNLMSRDIWRTDEVWFAEKRIDGSTDLYSLYQFSPRFDKNLQKGYWEGKYGAIPMIGDLDNA